MKLNDEIDVRKSWLCASKARAVYSNHANNSGDRKHRHSSHRKAPPPCSRTAPGTSDSQCSLRSAKTCDSASTPAPSEAYRPVRSNSQEREHAHKTITQRTNVDQHADMPNTNSSNKEKNEYAKSTIPIHGMKLVSYIHNLKHDFYFRPLRIPVLLPGAKSLHHPHRFLGHGARMQVPRGLLLRFQAADALRHPPEVLLVKAAIDDHVFADHVHGSFLSKYDAWTNQESSRNTNPRSLLGETAPFGSSTAPI